MNGLPFPPFPLGNMEPPPMPVRVSTLSAYEVEIEFYNQDRRFLPKEQTSLDHRINVGDFALLRMRPNGPALVRTSQSRLRTMLSEQLRAHHLEWEELPAEWQNLFLPDLG